MTYSPVSTIAVTGMGITTALGRGLEENWSALIAGKDARRAVSLFDVAECRCREAAEVTLPPVTPNSKLPRASRLAIPAAREALKQAGLLDENDQCRVKDLPVSLSTTAGGMEFGEDFLKTLLAGKAHYSRIARYQPQQQVRDLQDAFAICGPATLLANACASGANAIGHAADLIRSGRESLVLTGGFEALTELVFVGFDCLQALSPDQCRPFDQKRNGLKLGEGAAFLVLENAANARARGAEILCFLTGYGHGTDLHHLTQPHPGGKALVSVMEHALAQAGRNPADIAYVNAHGTATPMNDSAEAHAYLEIFKTHLPKISSTKSAVGHTLGAAGAVEAVFSILALLRQKAPPQIHTQSPLPKLASALAAMDERLDRPAHTMSVNLGFGGSNAALVFSKDPPPGSEKRNPARKIIAPLSVAVCGQGAVSPAGSGIDSLFLAKEPAQREMALLSKPALSVPVLGIDTTNAEIEHWKQHPRLRRASPLTLFMATAAGQALGGFPESIRRRMGIVAAFGTGCNIYSRRFYADILLKGRKFASPILFPETVFNSPTSHVAAAFGICGPCYSMAGDETAWNEALRVAGVWLENGSVDHVLVLGAEESDVTAMEAYRAFGWLRPNKPFRPSEGAAALLVTRPAKTNDAQIDLSGRTISYRTRAQAIAAMEECARALPVGSIVLGESSHAWTTPLARQAFADFEKNGETLPYLGEAFPASAGWKTLRGLRRLKETPRLTIPIIGSNAAVSCLTLRRQDQ